MDPLTVSAQFAAYMWFSDQEACAVACRTAAMRFAHAHWEAFLPIADKGVGRLLLRLAKGPRVSRREPLEPPAAPAATSLKPGTRSLPQGYQRFSMN